MTHRETIRRSPKHLVAALIGLLPMALLLVSSHPARAQQAFVCANHGPLTLAKITSQISNHVAQDRIAKSIQACKVNFALDADAIDQLAQSGASAEVLDALNRITSAGLILSDARAQVDALESRAQQVGVSGAADRDRALAAFDADTEAGRQKAAHIDPKGDFESTAQYNQRQQQNEAKLAELARARQAERSRLSSTWDAKTAAKQQPYRTRIDFLKSINYVDTRAILYKTYNPDTLLLTATVDGDEYSFENVPAVTAQTLHNSWATVKLAQPFAEGELHQRFLVLPSATIPGYSVKAKQQGFLEGHLRIARQDMERRKYGDAIAEYRNALALAPDNSEARDGLATATAILKKRDAFVAGLPASGVWLDKDTNLMWTMKKSDHMLNWNAANEYCQSFSAAGLSGWRLPTIQELKGINDESVTKTRRSPVPGQSTYSHMKGPVDVTGMVVFIWSSTRTTNGGAAEYWFDMTKMDAAPLEQRIDRHALCTRQYSPATDGLDSSSVAASPKQQGDSR